MSTADEPHERPAATDRTPGGQFTADGARAAVQAQYAAMTADERSAKARRAIAARWAGHTPKRKSVPALDPETLEVWVDEVRERFPAEAATMTPAELKRRAILLLKAERAKAQAGIVERETEADA